MSKFTREKGKGKGRGTKRPSRQPSPTPSEENVATVDYIQLTPEGDDDILSILSEVTLSGPEFVSNPVASTSQETERPTKRPRRAPTPSCTNLAPTTRAVSRQNEGDKEEKLRRRAAEEKALRHDAEDQHRTRVLERMDKMNNLIERLVNDQAALLARVSAMVEVTVTTHVRLESIQTNFMRHTTSSAPLHPPLETLVPSGHNPVQHKEKPETITSRSPMWRKTVISVGRQR